MFYQFVQTIAFSRTTIAVEQLMTKTLSNVGHSYIVDCQAQGKEGIYPLQSFEGESTILVEVE